MKYEIGDILLRNNIPLQAFYKTDPKKIKIIGYSTLDKAATVDFKLNLCNGYIIQDIYSDKKECATYEYVECYYYLDQRKEKLQKINNYR